MSKAKSTPKTKSDASKAAPKAEGIVSDAPVVAVVTSETLADEPKITEAAVKDVKVVAKKVMPKVVTAPKALVKPVAPEKSKATPKVAAPKGQTTAKVPPLKKAKVAAPTAKAVAVENAKTVKAHVKKPKLIRDSFTFPESDYSLLAALKLRALGNGHEIKKSELLRAGLIALQSLADSDLVKVLATVERIKTGRPAKK